MHKKTSAQRKDTNNTKNRHKVKQRPNTQQIHIHKIHSTWAFKHIIMRKDTQYMNSQKLGHTKYWVQTGTKSHTNLSWTHNIQGCKQEDTQTYE